MPNEIDVKGLRERAAWFAGDGGIEPQACREAVREFAAALPALLDRIEELEKERDDWRKASISWEEAAHRVRDEAETELSALKEKMEKVLDKALEWQAGPNVDYDWCGGRILAILDGKEVG
jgi:hypothetical protein